MGVVFLTAKSRPSKTQGVPPGGGDLPAVGSHFSSLNPQLILSMTSSTGYRTFGPVAYRSSAERYPAVTSTTEA